MVFSDEQIDFMINKLNELQIKTYFEDKKRQKIRYVKKTRVYKDLIDLLIKIKSGIYREEK